MSVELNEAEQAREKALSKIKKLLRLGKSSNEHEAAAAMRQAAKLMKEHHLDEDAVNEDVTAVWRTIYCGVRNINPALAAICSAVHRVFSVEAILAEYVNGPNTKYPMVCVEVRFYGRGASAQLAVYAAKCMQGSLDRDRTAWLKTVRYVGFKMTATGPVKTSRELTTKEKRAKSPGFNLAWLSAAYSHLLDIAPDADMVEVARARAARDNPNTATSEVKEFDTNVDAVTARAGHEAGDKFRIHRPLGTDGNTTNAEPRALGHDKR